MNRPKNQKEVPSAARTSGRKFRFIVSQHRHHQPERLKVPSCPIVATSESDTTNIAAKHCPKPEGLQSSPKQLHKKPCHRSRPRRVVTPVTWLIGGVKGKCWKPGWWGQGHGRPVQRGDARGEVPPPIGHAREEERRRGAGGRQAA